MSVIIDCRVNVSGREINWRCEQKDEVAQVVINLMKEIKGNEVRATYFPEVLGWQVTSEFDLQYLKTLEPVKV